jgi:rhodanese-related sulfurtransferase
MTREALVLLAVAIAVGTAFHTLRTDAKSRIKFVDKDKYPLALVVRKEPPPPAPVAPPAPGAPSNLSPVPPPPPADAAASSANPAPAEPAAPPPSGIEEITPEVAYEEFKAGGALFVDARRTKQYEDGHIQGARSLSLWEADFDQRLDAFLNREDSGQPIIVYCMSKNCEDSHNVGLRLKGAGFLNVRVMKGGFPEWKHREYPSETGPEKPPE